MDVFKIVGKIALEGKDAFDKDINDAKGKGANLASVVGKGLATVAKVGAVALAAASTAIVAVGKASLDAYAEYEQLVGGVGILFEESAGLVQTYASQAFRTAGMSANDYMAMVTGFSASLLQSLGGDTEKAANVADMAIRDMSDNANKMGTDIGLIQNAYQGFAKQNFTMLDNLKLGYGGTKTEMERLLADANRINREHGITSNYTIDNLADIYEAINVVQRDMGIFGATEAEAANTITGSVNAAKAAWENLIVGFADGNQDLDVLIDNFVGSVTTAAEQIVPKLGDILGGISEAMAEIMPIIAEELPGLLEKLLPGVIKGAGALITGLIEALPELLGVLWEALGQVVSGIWDYVFVDLLGTDYDFDALFEDLTEAAEQAWSEMSETWEAIGRPIFDMVVECVEITRDAFAQKMPEMAGFFGSCSEDIENYWNNNLQPCLGAIGGYIETDFAPKVEAVFGLLIPAVVEAGFQLISDLWNNFLMPVLIGITDFLTGVFTGDWEQAILGIEGILEGFDGFFQSLWDALVTFLKTLFAPVVPYFEELWNNIKETLATAIETMKEKWEEFKEAIAEKVESAVATVTTKFGEIKQQIESKVNDAKDKVKEAFSAIEDEIGEKMDAAKEKVQTAIEAIKGFFDFEFSWPHMPLPHFAISPSGWKIEDLLNGVIPSLSVQWYAKGGILNNPTIFGMNGNQLMVGGEAGPEAVAPIETLQGYVAAAVASQNVMLVEALDRIHGAILSLDENMGGHLKDAIDDTSLKVNNREFGRLVRGVT